LLTVVLCGVTPATFAGNFHTDFDLSFGHGRARILDGGDLLTLSLDSVSGSGFRSKNPYLYGKIDMQIKLVSGNSAGTVTAYYLSSLGENHDEIDFEFLGNLSGHPYVLHTNVFTRGRGGREQQFYLWFDPTKDFHTYSILWNPNIIIFTVDGIPIRRFLNLESRGVPYPVKQPMWVYSSIWNADDWATRKGEVKIDWKQAPFTASYRNFKAQYCSSSNRTTTSGGCDDSWYVASLDDSSQEMIKWVQKNYLVYNYCTDSERFIHGFPLEC
ncbi:hypothetical protein M569_08724, partial [Genlisea aurea]